MAKTIKQALLDEVIYPLPDGLVDNKLIARQLSGDDEFTYEVSKSDEYRGAYADCLVGLLQAISFSEADKSISAISDEAKKKLLVIANSIYKDLGEDTVDTGDTPRVYINC